MADAIRFGQVVWAEIADANGVGKDRPVIVVSPDVGASNTVDVVAITSRIDNPLPDDHVLLPWHAQGHPRTGLNRKSVAVCSWVSRIAVSDIKNVVGIVTGPILLDILSKIKSSPETEPS